MMKVFEAEYYLETYTSDNKYLNCAYYRTKWFVAEKLEDVSNYLKNLRIEFKEIKEFAIVDHIRYIKYIGDATVIGIKEK